MCKLTRCDGCSIKYITYQLNPNIEKDANMGPRVKKTYFYVKHEANASMFKFHAKLAVGRRKLEPNSAEE